MGINSLFSTYKCHKTTSVLWLRIQWQLLSAYEEPMRVSFDYSGNKLVSVTYPDGEETHYSYYNNGALKDAVTEAVIAELTPIQERYNAIIADKDGLAAMLKRNAERAYYLAQKTLRKVYKKVGLYQG